MMSRGLPAKVGNKREELRIHQRLLDRINVIEIVFWVGPGPRKVDTMGW